jgi:hypothetical protein
MPARADLFAPRGVAVDSPECAGSMPVESVRKHQLHVRRQRQGLESVTCHPTPIGQLVVLKDDRPAVLCGAVENHRIGRLSPIRIVHQELRTALRTDQCERPQAQACLLFKLVTCRLLGVSPGSIPTGGAPPGSVVAMPGEQHPTLIVKDKHPPPG